MEITSRQQQILDEIIQEYISSAQPVASEWLKNKHHFDICPATIRIEMQKLTEQGFLSQLHTSGGRVPTARAYRFFVDNLFRKKGSGRKFLTLENEKYLQSIKDDVDDIFRVCQSLTEAISSVSFSLAISYLSGKDFLWKEGWEEVFQEPEFEDADYTRRFIRAARTVEKEINQFLTANKGLQIYIGQEAPLLNSDDFSMLLSPCRFPQEQKGLVMLLGPKRMAYQKNIALLNEVVELLASL